MIRVGAGDLNVHLTVEFPQGRGGHHPFLFPPSAIHTHTPPATHTHTDTHIHTVWECWGKQPSFIIATLPRLVPSVQRVRRQSTSSTANVTQLPLNCSNKQSDPESDIKSKLSQVIESSHQGSPPATCQENAGMKGRGREEGECDSSFIIDPLIMYKHPLSPFLLDSY